MQVVSRNIRDCIMKSSPTFEKSPPLVESLAMSSPAAILGDIWLPETDCPEEADHAAHQWRLRRSRHWSMLRLCAFVVVLACLLEVRPDQRVQFRFGPEWALPESCGSKMLWGRECPGCGLTRGFIWLTRGQAWTAWSLNRMSWILAGALLVQFPYRAWALADLRDCQHRGLPLPTRRWPTWCSWVLIGGLIGAWGLKQWGF